MGNSGSRGDGDGDDAGDDEASTTTTPVSAKRQAMWSNLLTKRPRTKDPKKLSSWLNEVLAVSDMDFPLGQVGTTELMDDSLGSTLLLNHLPNLSQINSDTTATVTGTSSTTTEDDVEKL